MQLPLQVVFKGLPSSEAVNERIAQKVSKLEQSFGRIISCRVVIETPHRHHHKGKTFHVSVDLQLPGAEVLATRDAAKDDAHEDVYVAIRDAFDAVQRQLQEHVRRQQVDERRLPLP
jgi:ribosomal subunit interface protein